MQHLLRRKIIYTGIIILLCPVIGFAQLRERYNLPDHDEKPIRFGINLGMNRSHFSFTHNPVFLQQAPFDSITVVESINSTGINLAWMVNFRLNDHFDLRTYPVNLTFTEKAFEYNVKYPDGPGAKLRLLKKKYNQSLLLYLYR